MSLRGFGGSGGCGISGMIMSWGLTSRVIGGKACAKTSAVCAVGRAIDLRVEMGSIILMADICDHSWPKNHLLPAYMLIPQKTGLFS